MAENPKIFNENDTMEINELISLNNDISDELIEQLQSKVSQSANQLTGKPVMPQNSDAELFEEVEEPTEIKNNENTETIKAPAEPIEEEEQVDLKDTETDPQESQENIPVKPDNETKETSIAPEEKQKKIAKEFEEIEKLTGGNIVERPADQEQIKYNDSLNFIDENKKYSKYVIYIDPENEEFIESLTVKERKNIINKVLKDQHSVNVSIHKINTVRSVIKHSIVALITIAIAIPLIYSAINAALEVTVHNYRYSKAVFKTLYKENGKIKIRDINY